MKDDYTTNSHYLTYAFILRKVGRMYFLNLGVKRLSKVVSVQVLGSLSKPIRRRQLELLILCSFLSWLKFLPFLPQFYFFIVSIYRRATRNFSKWLSSAISLFHWRCRRGVPSWCLSSLLVRTFRTQRRVNLCGKNVFGRIRLVTAA